ncbi:SH3 domain-binding glutamic acid-rich-like protein 3 [Hydra vulgaris]|uniref:SH3 domain-binding glutamic acid-rich-like protein 3 n=1 Tax=Hydra vulgaris TaxID=6087 RepID=A0ABM4BW32_HYDVU
MGVIVYVSSVSSSTELKKHQQKITMVLDGKKIPYEVKDIASSEEAKTEMKHLAGVDAHPPQIANDNVYCGDFFGFDEAVESEELSQFLKL